MTRRTDWAEYEHAASGIPRGRATGGDTDSAVGGEDAYGGDGLYRGDRLYGDDEPNGGRLRGEPYGEQYGGGSLGGGSGSTARDCSESTSAGGSEGSPGGDSRGGGARRGRGRRRRGFEDAADPQDGGALSLSRAEQEAPPGDPVEQARAICLRLLTGTPRTRKQLADALRKRQIPDDAAEEVLSRFEEVGLINDGAFADAWVESRHHGRGLARRALARELRTKGVDSTLIDEAVSQLDSEQEEATARELVARKLRSTRGLDRDKRLRRLAGMLARKGYPEGMALRVVRQALEEEGEDTEFLGDEGF
ncbi:recombination regulator RecX [Streptomyces sp. NPDC006624]|uniref:recombination regulator RecX n=1 Tax=Streptomyces sp. NPDC006624 TaxID=3154892 RepID=UPI0033A9D326